MVSLFSPTPSSGAVACSASLLSPRLSPSPSFGDCPSHPTFHFPIPSSAPLLLLPNPRSRLRKQDRLSPANAIRGSSATAERCKQQTSEAPRLYAVLGIGQNASVAEIKKAYRQMARRYHPDVCLRSDKGHGIQMFLQVQEAYDILSDPDRRANYDYSLLHRFSPHALGRGFAPSSIGNQKRGKTSRSDVSEVWTLQWEAQLNRLHQKRGKVSSNESWGETMRRRMQENN